MEYTMFPLRDPEIAYIDDGTEIGLVDGEALVINVIPEYLLEIVTYPVKGIVKLKNSWKVKEFVVMDGTRIIVK